MLVLCMNTTHDTTESTELQKINWYKTEDYSVNLNNDRRTKTKRCSTYSSDRFFSF